MTYDNASNRERKRSLSSAFSIRHAGRRILVPALAISLFYGLSSTACSDEFSVVPAGDTAYRQLNLLGKTGWIDERDFTPRAGDSSTTLTRYEIALEVARAVFYLTERRKVETAPSLVQGTVSSSNAVRALRELTTSFRTELKELGVDSAAALKLCDDLLKPSVSLGGEKTASSTAIRPTLSSPSRTAALPVTKASAAPERATGPSTSVENGLALFGMRRRAEAEMPLSQRLRLNAAISMLSRTANDPLRFSFSGNRNRAGLSLKLADWLSLNAGAFQSNAELPRLPFSLSPLDGASARGVRGLDGGVNISLPRGVTLSGEVEALKPVGDGTSWRRYEGELGVSTWQNRLSLNANLARLVPDDARLLPSTLGGLNLGLDVSDRMSLTLLYQQLFDMPADSSANRMVAGGLSIKF